MAAIALDQMEQQRWLEATTAEDDEESGGNSSLQTFSIVMSNMLLFFLIFGLSATVEVKNMRTQIRNKKAIATGVAMQFLIMPFLGFVAIMMLRDTGFTEAMGITLIIVTSSPGGSYSNWWCSLFNAELALSVAMTSVSSILSVALLPANTLFYSWLAYGVVLTPDDDLEDIDVLEALDFGAIFITLGVVMGAILSGLYVGYKFDNATFHTRANKFGSICGLSLILFSAFLGSGAGEADTNFWSLDWSFYVGVAFPCAVGMTLANIISRSLTLSPPETVAISIECCYQNTAIATSVAVTMFDDPDTVAEAVSVPLFYGLVEAVIIFIYCLWAWKVGWTKAPANEKICVVVTHTYEVDGHEREECDQPVNPEELTWWGRMFVPREKMVIACEDIDDELATPMKDATCDVDNSRDRIYSADVTVATTAPTPRTPEASLEPIPQEMENDLSDIAADLEAPSIRGGNGSRFLSPSVSAVPEVSEEASLEINASQDVEDFGVTAVIQDPPKLESSASAIPEGVAPEQPQVNAAQEEEARVGDVPKLGDETNVEPPLSDASV